MTIAVISDIHDNIWNLETALRMLATREPKHLFVLGDLCAPFTLKQIAEALPVPTEVVFGNNDGDPHLISTVAASYPHVTIHGQIAELDIAGKRVALNHYPEIGRALALSGQYDAVFSGHDHRMYVEHHGSCLWANPGEIMGRFGEPSFGIWETDPGTFTHVRIG